jgi:hypothetical protein
MFDAGKQAAMGKYIVYTFLKEYTLVREEFIPKWIGWEVNGRCDQNR